MNILGFEINHNKREIENLDSIVESINSNAALYKTLDLDLEQLYELFSGKVRWMKADIKEKLSAISQDPGEEEKDFKKRYSSLETEVLSAYIPEMFAMVKEAVRKVKGKELYDVQLKGGIALHQGKIAEMKTGEGKTLTALLPAALNALTGNGVHLVTVNPYLAQASFDELSPIFSLLGFSSSIVHDSDPDMEIKKQAYQADITIGTNDSFAFDYLRDNTAQSLDKIVQRGQPFALIDEIDHVLIDEAQTPFIFSRPEGLPPEIYQDLNLVIEDLIQEQYDKIDERLNLIEAKKDCPDLSTAYHLSLVRRLAPNNSRLKNLIEANDKLKDLKPIGWMKVPRQARSPKPGISKPDRYKFVEKEADEFYLKVDEAKKTVELTEKGIDFLEEKGISLDDANETSKAVLSLLQAHMLYEPGREYIIHDGKILVRQEGRVSSGKEYCEGLQQALQAKHRLETTPETRSIASITLPNLYRQYTKFAGMTGTALTEAKEFSELFDKEVLEIPTNLPVIREDLPDTVVRTTEEKHKILLEKIKDLRHSGRPVLVSAATDTEVETLARILDSEDIPYNKLTAAEAKDDPDYERQVIGSAGKTAQVTLSTQMVGRGTDIILSDEAKDFGGLYVIGLELRSERKKNQLRGRAGRQGQPGTSEFMIALEEMPEVWNKIGSIEADNPVVGTESYIGKNIIPKIIPTIQKQRDSATYAARKSMHEFNTAPDIQRKTIYAERLALLKAADLTPTIYSMLEKVADNISKTPDLETLENWVKEVFNLDVSYQHDSQEKTDDSSGLGLNRDETETLTIGSHVIDILNLSPEEKQTAIKEAISSQMKQAYDSSGISTEQARSAILSSIDPKMEDFIEYLESLKQDVDLLKHAGKNPSTEYKILSSEVFNDMLYRIQEDAVKNLGIRHDVSAPKKVMTPKADKVEEEIISVDDLLDSFSDLDYSGRNDSDPGTLAPSDKIVESLDAGNDHSVLSDIRSSAKSSALQISSGIAASLGMYALGKYSGMSLDATALSMFGTYLAAQAGFAACKTRSVLKTAVQTLLPPIASALAFHYSHESCYNIAALSALGITQTLSNYLFDKQAPEKDQPQEVKEGLLSRMYNKIHDYFKADDKQKTSGPETPSKDSTDKKSLTAEEKSKILRGVKRAPPKTMKTDDDADYQDRPLNENEVTYEEIFREESAPTETPQSLEQTVEAQKPRHWLTKIPTQDLKNGLKDTAVQYALGITGAAAAYMLAAYANFSDVPSTLSALLGFTASQAAVSYHQDDIDAAKETGKLAALTAITSCLTKSAYDIGSSTLSLLGFATASGFVLSQAAQNIKNRIIGSYKTAQLQNKTAAISDKADKFEEELISVDDLLDSFSDLDYSGRKDSDPDALAPSDEIADLLDAGNDRSVLSDIRSSARSSALQISSGIAASLGMYALGKYSGMSLDATALSMFGTYLAAQAGFAAYNTRSVLKTAAQTLLPPVASALAFHYSPESCYKAAALGALALTQTASNYINSQKKPKL